MQVEAPEEVRPKNDALTFLRRRRNLLRGRNVRPDMAFAGQPPRVAEEGDVVFDDIRAILVAGSLSRHEGSGLTSRRCGREAGLGDKGPHQHFSKLRALQKRHIREILGERNFFLSYI